ncbi:polyphenol oxidase YfiH [Gammaproteobacteria bacterium]
MPTDLQVLTPDWPAPPWVHAYATTRLGGVSKGVYVGLNLGNHVGDETGAVLTNRAVLRAMLTLPESPRWLKQVHGTRVFIAEELPFEATPEADGACSRTVDTVCAVLTADCLPILLCDRSGTCVAALHAGWRGLAAGVVEAGVQSLLRWIRSPKDILAWFGPGIGPCAYEVGEEVRATFLATDAMAEEAFVPNPSGRWFANMPMLAKQRLARLGVEAVYGGTHCTWTDADRFYSYRREGLTGRMATLIWLARSSDALRA